LVFGNLKYDYYVLTYYKALYYPLFFSPVKHKTHFKSVYSPNALHWPEVVIWGWVISCINTNYLLPKKEIRRNQANNVSTSRLY